MKTPITQAIEKIKFAQKHIISNTQYAQGYDGGLSYCINVLTELIPKEKEVMKDFYLTACIEYSQTETALESDIKEFETYFNETFTQK
jgi:hypothetical protein